MQILQPINVQNDTVILHPFRDKDQERFQEITNDVYRILSDVECTTYIPEKRVYDLGDANKRMTGYLLGYHIGKSYAHFLTEKSTMKMIGLVDIISPEKVKASYKLNVYHWMVEYYLDRSYWGSGIMSSVVDVVCRNMIAQGVSGIGAACDRSNARSIRLLENVGFKNSGSFDFEKDYYIL